MERTIRYIILSITMGVGSYIPVVFGATIFDLWSILGTLIGGIAGIWLIRRLGY